MDPSTPSRRSSEDVFKLRKPLDKMTPAELCEEATRIREGIEVAAERLNGIYSYLYASTRRRTSDDMTYAYLSVANSGKRFSGMILQASRRTAGTENRALLLAQREIEEKDRLREAGAKRKQAETKKEQKAQARPTDPLESLFGVPFMPTEATPDDSEVDSIAQSYMDASQGPSADLDDLYGEELT